MRGLNVLGLTGWGLELCFVTSRMEMGYVDFLAFRPTTHLGWRVELTKMLWSGSAVLQAAQHLATSAPFLLRGPLDSIPILVFTMSTSGESRPPG